eukprot:CAMPEP_0172464372 /NCGR_PEP_ID=MMETSP1065-20121228/50259_1 /TAXON_ID=265537 /ORGANISM="Amphiprora paludosa, Strain CCMP125" /LENGTH=449 /DNA_ID=CAMNT_0013220581 /DNA_START=19 /DNA_END=1368 /DNA_ORIENTATION=-
MTNSSKNDKFQAIVDKNKEQAMVGVGAESLSEEQEKQNKKDKKKYMKQGNAMAGDFIEDDLKLDPSVVDVEVVVSGADLIATDGCLAACLLDAGCATVVTDGSNLDALDAAKIPKNRLMAHFSLTTSDDAALMEQIVQAQAFCDLICIQFTQATDVSAERVEALLGKIPKDLHVVFQFAPKLLIASDAESLDSLTSVVAAMCKLGKESRGTVALTDPTAQELGRSYAACVVTDRPDGLYTTVVCTRSGEALGLVYSSTESIVAALECGRGVYYSRSRKGLWRKGDTSGHYQTLHRLDVDCDGDALRFTVTQRGEDHAAFCHLNTLTCWGPPRGVRHLQETLQDRLQSAPEGSYTKRLFEDTELLRDKLVEEAQELSEADTKQHVAEELADVLYFAMTRAVKAGVSIDDAVSELDKRARKVTRRKGDSKAFRIAAGEAILGAKSPAAEGS